MTEPSRTTPATTPRRPSTVALAILITLSLLAVAALGWLWLTRYAPVHFDVGGDATISDARASAFIGPLLGLGVFLIALLWLGTWIRARWDITPLPIIVGMIGVLALVLAGRAARDVRDRSHQRDAGARIHGVRDRRGRDLRPCGTIGR